MFTLKFWKATFERTVRTAAASLGTYLVADVSITDVDWGQAFGITGGITLATVLMAIAGGATSGEGPGVTERVKDEGNS